MKYEVLKRQREEKEKQFGILKWIYLAILIVLLVAVYALFRISNWLLR